MKGDGMMFPKEKRRKRRRKSPESVMVKGRKRLWSIFKIGRASCRERVLRLV